MKITLAKSKAGHDRNHIYIIYKEETDTVCLINGRNKKIANAKCKKKIHIQPIKNLPMEVTNISDTMDEIDDENTVKIIKAYEQYLLKK